MAYNRCYVLNVLLIQLGFSTTNSVQHSIPFLVSTAVELVLVYFLFFFVLFCVLFNFNSSLLDYRHLLSGPTLKFTAFNCLKL